MTVDVQLMFHYVEPACVFRYRGAACIFSCEGQRTHTEGLETEREKMTKTIREKNSSHKVMS